MRRCGSGTPITVGDQGATFGRTFADVPAGAIVLYEDASRRLAIAVNSGSAAETLELRTGDRVLLAPA